MTHFYIYILKNSRHYCYDMHILKNCRSGKQLNGEEKMKRDLKNNL